MSKSYTKKHHTSFYLTGLFVVIDTAEMCQTRQRNRRIKVLNRSVKDMAFEITDCPVKPQINSNSTFMPLDKLPKRDPM
jgi:hypothetical protein